MRNSLRLFALLTALGAVNVYVFFFNRGTAPREILKPSSLARTEGLRETLKEDQAAAEAAALEPTVAPVAPAGSVAPAEATRDDDPSRPHAPRILSPDPGKGAAGASRPKASPGGSPGLLARTFRPSRVLAPWVPAWAASLPVPAPPSSSPPAPQAPSSQAPRPLDVRPPWSPYPPMPLPPQASLWWPKPPPAAGSPSGIASPSPSSSEPTSPSKKIGPTDTLGAVLAREGFGSAAPAVVAALTRVFDPRQLRPGQAYHVRLDEEGEPEAFEIETTPVTRFLVTRTDAEGWRASKSEQPVELKTVEAAGVIESSLYESIQKAGESSALAGALVELFAWDINFFTDTHPGDRWKVMVEKQMLGGQFYRYGHLLAAEYSGRVGTFRAFYWKSPKVPEGRYYDEKGQSISKSFLKTPLRFVRISSKFDLKRFHPILHREKAHLGVDYAAPVGTPVWASAGGQVAECAMKRGSGNTVVIKHGNGLATRYYHLSRFARGLRAGQAVRQKQLIGYVGTTGLSTGPHLHFSVTKNGAFVDPLKVQVNRDAPVPDRAAFLAAVRPRVDALAALQPSALTARN